MKSTNTFAVSGRLTSDANIYDGKNGKVARFSIAHNFGRDMDPLFVDAVMFSKNGKKEVSIPESLLKKGQAVTVSGYLRPNNNTKDGKTYRSIDFVVFSCSAPEDEAEAEGEAEAETKAEA